MDKSGLIPSPRTASLGFRFIWLVIYFGSMFLATFFNVAFYSEIIAALNGKGVSFRRGFSHGSQPIAIHSRLVSFGRGGRMDHSRHRATTAVCRRIVTGLIGMAWSIAAVFAIPVIIQEQPMRNPIKILQQSAMTLKRTWGEGLIGYLGFSAGSLVILCLRCCRCCWPGVALLIKSMWFMSHCRSGLDARPVFHGLRFRCRQPRLSLRPLYVCHRRRGARTLQPGVAGHGLEGQKEFRETVKSSEGIYEHLAKTEKDPFIAAWFCASLRVWSRRPFPI
jgi:hypothetical protein